MSFFAHSSLSFTEILIFSLWLSENCCMNICVPREEIPLQFKNNFICFIAAKKKKFILILSHEPKLQFTFSALRRQKIIQVIWIYEFCFSLMFTSRGRDNVKILIFFYLRLNNFTSHYDNKQPERYIMIIFILLTISFLVNAKVFTFENLKPFNRMKSLSSSSRSFYPSAIFSTSFRKSFLLFIWLKSETSFCH